MQHINRLLVQVRKSVHPAICAAICFVTKDEATGKWNADPRLWDGVPGSGFMDGAIPNDWPREYDSAAEAQEAVYSLLGGLGLHERDIVVFMMDYGDLEE